jgi:hypothetical protein
MLANLLRTANHVSFGNLIDGIDYVHAFYPVEISLVNRVHPVCTVARLAGQGNAVDQAER